MTTPINDSSVVPVSNNPADPAAQAAVPSSGSGGNVSGNTTFSSMEEMRKKEPELYRLMTVSMATNMVNEMHDREEKLKEKNKKERSEIYGS